MLDTRTIIEAFVIVLAALGGYKAQGFRPSNNGGKRMSPETRIEINRLWDKTVLVSSCEREHSHVKNRLDSIEEGVKELLRRPQ
uniref:Uncharacterized protein n=1 Tax=viral metagenome TaxID=1070528 RepID=A0A6M3J278_9ZZZZ